MKTQIIEKREELIGKLKSFLKAIDKSGMNTFYHNGELIFIFDFLKELESELQSLISQIEGEEKETNPFLLTGYELEKAVNKRKQY